MWELVAATTGGVGAAAGAVAAVVAGRAQARATSAAATVAAEPAQRAADLAAFREIRSDLEGEVRELRDEQTRLRGLVWAFAAYVKDMAGVMRGHGIEPPEPPERITEYNRTGV